MRLKLYNTGLLYFTAWAPEVMHFSFWCSQGEINVIFHQTNNFFSFVSEILLFTEKCYIIQMLHNFDPVFMVSSVFDVQ